MTDLTTADPRTAELAELRIRLHRLETLDEIRRLYVDYGCYVDEGNFAALASLFTHEAKLRITTAIRADGRAEIERVMTEVLGPNPRKRMVHVIGVPRIELDGERATGEALWMAVVNGPDGKPAVVSVGRHCDELVREDGQWLFASRQGVMDLPSS